MYENKKKMKDLPKSERPYEKCMQYGAESLSDGELLAVILRSGTKQLSALEIAWEILDKHPVYKGLAGLYHLTETHFQEIPGIGKVKTIELLCVLELSKRLARTCVEKKYDFSAPDFIAAYYMESMRHQRKEQVLLLLLDQKHQLLKEIILSKGSVNQAVVSIKDIFAEALRAEASHIVLLHNHPSGNPEPSREDLLFTNRLKDASQLMGIPLVDHIIIGDQCYMSMKEEAII